MEAMTARRTQLIDKGMESLLLVDERIDLAYDEVFYILEKLGFLDKEDDQLTEDFLDHLEQQGYLTEE